MPVPKKILNRKDEITADFLAIMEKHIHDLMEGRDRSRFGASTFATRLFIHPRHLTNTIKLTTGKSPCDFMEERILLEAQQLLEETALPIAEIALKFGYEEPANFTKFFKGMAGITPLQYRKKNRAMI